MKNTKKTLITGTMIAGAVLGTISMNATETNLFNYNELGSGSVIRANLINQTEADFKGYLLELNCGEKTKKATETKKTEDKSKEAKCGEGKCGETKAKQGKAGDVKAVDAKSTKAKTTKASKESKSKEAKCGEGKCGVE